MSIIPYRQALNEALDEEMAYNRKVVCFGEHIGEFAGGFAITKGLWEKYGSARVIDAPIAEGTIIGAAVGMALGGLTVVPELGFSDFVDCAMDEINNKMGKWRYMHGGKLDIPVILRLECGIMGGGGPEHSRCTWGEFMNSQGLIIAMPSNPYDAKGMLKTAIRGKDPVLFFEHKRLFAMKGEVPDEEYFVPFGKARVVREGSDVTIVALSAQVVTAENAAEELAKEGISAEVIDPRTLVPLDEEAIIDSVKKTGRLIIVHEEATRGGSGAEIGMTVVEKAYKYLKAPIKRLGAPNVPIAQSTYLEQYYLPSEEKIIEAAKELLAYE